MVPRIKIQRPSTSSIASTIVPPGTPVDMSLPPRLIIKRHDARFDDYEVEEDGNVYERVISWDDQGAFAIGEKRDSWDERKRWWKVYALHFLFMWNSRTFEYVSIVLVALAFPHSLTATSIRGITSTISSMLFASAVGNWIDRAPARLPALLITIVLNHAAIIASYLCWLYWPVITGNTDESTGSQAAGPFSNFSRGFMYGLILFLDVVHDLSAIANRLSVERDWIPTLVGPITPDLSYDLTQINSVFVRIEHIVKLVAPSLLPLIMSTITIRAKWILLLIGMTVLLWVIEVWFARAIAAENPELQAAKKPSHNMDAMEDTPVSERFSHLKLGVQSWPQKLCVVLYRDPAARLKHFFSIRMWPASMSVSLLQLTVLAYSATLITYLLEVGFSLSLITIGKASGSITALASTIITPAAVRYMRKRQARRQRIGESEDDDLDGGEGRIVRTVGLWGIASQFLFLIPVVFILWNLPSSTVHHTATRDSNTDTAPPDLFIPMILFTFLSLSRVGHIAIQLMVQELGQVEIPVSQRSTFAGTEQSFHSMGELCHWAATVVWSRPSQFGWLALGSLGFVGVSTIVYVWWAEKPVNGPREQEYEGIALGGLGDEDDEDRY